MLGMMLIVSKVSVEWALSAQPNQSPPGATARSVLQVYHKYLQKAIVNSSWLSAHVVPSLAVFALTHLLKLFGKLRCATEWGSFILSVRVNRRHREKYSWITGFEFLTFSLRILNEIDIIVRGVAIDSEDLCTLIFVQMYNRPYLLSSTAKNSRWVLRSGF